MRMKSLFLLASLALILQAGSAAAAGGSAQFNPSINWQKSPNLYYNVNGGPPNTCGDLNARRNNGPWTITYGWICTDGSGNATKGPWTWDNQNGDEDARAYISWPDATGTNQARHIWDKTAPSITINPFTSTPPTSFTGSAYDGPYGSGFSAKFLPETTGVGFDTASLCRVRFKNVSTGLYWCPELSSYTGTVACTVDCTISGMPSRSVTWAANQVPPGSVHSSGQSYQWTVIIYDNANLGHRTEKPSPIFTKP